MKVDKAIKPLTAAIALHQAHMDGTEPTTGAEGKKSQQKLMGQMERVLAALTDETEENAMTEAVPMPAEKTPPQVRLELKESEAKQLEGLKPGAKVVITVTGSIERLEMYNATSEGKAGYLGYLTIEATKTKIVSGEKNLFTELAEDEEEK